MAVRQILQGLAALVLFGSCTQTQGAEAPVAASAPSVPYQDRRRWHDEVSTRAAELEDRADRLALQAVLLEAPEVRLRLATALGNVQPTRDRLAKSVDQGADPSQEEWPLVQTDCDRALNVLHQGLELAQTGVPRLPMAEVWRQAQHLTWPRREDFRQAATLRLDNLDRGVLRLRRRAEGRVGQQAALGAAVSQLHGLREQAAAELSRFGEIGEDGWDMWKAGVRVRLDRLHQASDDQMRLIVGAGG
jgi:hypothetical protein